jgi:hypothetical protein
MMSALVTATIERLWRQYKDETNTPEGCASFNQRMRQRGLITFDQLMRQRGITIDKLPPIPITSKVEANRVINPSAVLADFIEWAARHGITDGAASAAFIKQQADKTIALIEEIMDCDRVTMRRWWQDYLAEISTGEGWAALCQRMHSRSVAGVIYDDDEVRDKIIAFLEKFERELKRQYKNPAIIAIVVERGTFNYPLHIVDMTEWMSARRHNDFEPTSPEAA